MNYIARAPFEKRPAGKVHIANLAGGTFCGVGKDVPDWQIDIGPVTCKRCDRFYNNRKEQKP